jgi:hypothetical protein
MTTLADLPIPPRVFFIDTHHDYGLSITGASLAHAMTSQTSPAITAWFSTPVESIVEELLSPLYEDLSSPLRPSDIVRTKWDLPIASGPGLGLSPKSLSQVISQMLPDSILPSLMNIFLKNILIDGDPDLPTIIIPDSEHWSIDATLALGDIPSKICCAIRIRPDDGKTYLLEPLACQSINLRFNSSVTDPKLIADLLPSSTLTPART